MKDFEADLPEGVRAALPEFRSISTGITALTICFILEDATARLLDEPLRADFRTLNTRDPRFRRRHVVPHVLWGAEVFGGYQIHDPDSQRRKAAQVAITEVANECRSWMATRLPGAFAASPNDDGPPSAVLLISETNPPLREESDRVGGFAAAGLSHSFRAWESDEWPNVRMVPADRFWNEDEGRLNFACRRKDAFPEQPGYHEPTSNWTIAQRANELIPGLLNRWAMTRLLLGYRETLAVGRDSAASRSSHRTIRDLKAVRTLVQTSAIDMRAASVEIEALTEDPHRYAWDVMEMRSVHEFGGTPDNLVENLRQSQSTLAVGVRDELDAFVSTLSATANFSQAISNIRIQRLVILATILSVVIATIALAVARGTGGG